MVCSRGESLTTYKNQMKLFTAIVTAAVIGPSSITTAPAEAAGCYASTATNEMETLMAGGATLKQAWNYTLKQEQVDGSDICWIKIKGYVRQFKIIRPYLYNAIFS